jgi:hypothetical protein
MSTNNTYLTFKEQCAICLETQLIPAMLLPCYHSFCIECITLWLEHNTNCPLCKRYVTDIIYDIKSENQYRILHLTNHNTQVSTVPDHEFRRRVYSTPLQCVFDKKIHFMKFSTQYFRERQEWYKKKMSPWIRRDLETILKTKQVDMMVEYVMSLLPNVELGREFVEKLSVFLKEEDAKKFCDELYMFACSKLSMKAYDQQVQYRKTE